MFHYGGVQKVTFENCVTIQIFVDCMYPKKALINNTNRPAKRQAHICMNKK